MIYINEYNEKILSISLDKNICDIIKDLSYKKYFKEVEVRAMDVDKPITIRFTN